MASRQSIRALRRMSAGVVDQAISAATNTVSFALIAGRSELASFGYVGVGGALCMLGALIARSFVGELLLIDPTRISRRSTSGGLVVGAVAGLLVVVCAILVRGELGLVLLVAGISLPGICVFDSLRFANFARQTVRKSIELDVAWFGLSVGAIGGSSILGFGSAPLYFFFWAAAPSVIVLYRLASGALRLGSAGGIDWLQEHWGLGLTFVLDALGSAGVIQFLVLASPMVLGPDGAGVVRIQFLVLGPIGVVFAGLYPVLLPMMRRLVERRDTRVLPISLGVSTGMISIAGCWMALLVASPALMSRLIGENWIAAEEHIVIAGVAYTGGAFGAGAIIGLRAHLMQKRIAKIRLGFLPASVALAAIAGLVWGTAGFFAGWGVSQWFQMAIVWVSYARTQRRLA